METIALNTYAHYLQSRPRDWHKGLSGHVLMVGGNLGLSGAVRMAAEAALRVGAGLATIATRPEHAAMMNASRPEIMCHGVNSAAQLLPLLAKADVVVLGPGLGRSVWSKALWEAVLAAKHLPMIIDADGLNLLAENHQFNQQWILTPHPGEAARLLDETSSDIQQDRLKALTAIQKRYGGVCVLKGAGTLVIGPDKAPAICEAGNPGMASAGMGDVLSGVIGGLVAQRIPLIVAAKLGVYLHAMAGDLAAAAGGERGLIATDLLPYLRQLSNPHES